MNSCLNEDTLLRIGAALDWELEEPLRHLHRCAECATMLEDLRNLDDAFSRSEPADPELMMRILGALDREMTAEGAAAVPVRTALAERGIRFFAAAVIAFVVLVTGAAMQAGQPVTVAPAVLLALLSGAIASALSGRRSREAAPGSR